MAERKPKPPIEEPETETETTAAPIPKAILQQAKKIAERWQEANRGGAPISPEFIAAALQQGLNPKEVKAILRSQALGGPRTSANYSSPELLDYFTANPGEIPGLLEAVRSVADAPATYAEYLAGGGEPGGYRAQNQLLQEGVLGIGGARDAYLAGTNRSMFAAEGNDPRRWYLDGSDWMAQQNPQEDTGAEGLAPLGFSDLQNVATASQSMLAARERRLAAQGDYFSSSELSGEME